jgi:deazaflavin-dependent oxidoreductase (nitroreductase family)
MDTTPRARTLRMQGLVNRVVRTVLRTPVLSSLAGRRLAVLEVVGRRSGRRFEVPVAYTRLGDVLLIGTQFAWGRNLRSGEPVTVRLGGRRRVADVEVLTGEDDVVAAYAEMARDNHQFAGFNGIGFDDRGEPVAEDLRLAWAGGARAFRLTPRP